MGEKEKIDQQIKENRERKIERIEKEIQEIKQIQIENEMKEIRENIEIITKQSDQIKEKQIKHQQQQKEKNVERLINMEKLKKSVEKINSELSNIEKIDGEGGLSAMQLSVICNITEQEAIDLINKYDIDGDGKLDYEEFK